jgi:hypothetical protein
LGGAVKTKIPTKEVDAFSTGKTVKHIEVPVAYAAEDNHATPERLPVGNVIEPLHVFSLTFKDPLVETAFTAQSEVSRSSLVQLVAFAILAVILSGLEDAILNGLPVQTLVWLFVVCICAISAWWTRLQHTRRHLVLAVALVVIVRILLFPGLLPSILERFPNSNSNLSGLRVNHDGETEVIDYVVLSSLLFTVFLPMCFNIRWKSAAPLALLLFLLQTLGLEMQLNHDRGGGLFAGQPPWVFTWRRREQGSTHIWLTRALPLQVACLFLIYHCEWAARQRFAALFHQNASLRRELLEARGAAVFRLTVGRLFTRSLQWRGAFSDCTPPLGAIRQQGQQLNRQLQRGLCSLMDVLADGSPPVNFVSELSWLKTVTFRRETVAFMLPQLLQSVQTLVAGPNGSGIRLMLEHEGAWAQPILADPIRLQQTVVNLLVCAIKFGGVKDLEITCNSSLRSRNEGRQEVLIELFDSQCKLNAEEVTILNTVPDPSSTKQIDERQLLMSLSRCLAGLLGPQGEVGVFRAKNGGCVYWLGFELQWAREADEALMWHGSHDGKYRDEGEVKIHEAKSPRRQDLDGSHHSRQTLYAISSATPGLEGRNSLDGMSPPDKSGGQKEEMDDEALPLQQRAGFKIPADTKSEPLVHFKWQDADVPKIQEMEKLGEGTYGPVFRARHISEDFDVAIKLMSVDPFTPPGALVADVDASMGLARHPNLVYTHHCWGPNAEGELWVAMDLCQISLDTLLETTAILLTEQQVAFVMACVLNGLEFLHNVKGSVHRRLQASKFFVTSEGQIKLGGFWHSEAYEDLLESEDNEIMLRSAPEVIQGGELSFASDIWALGLAAIEVAEGRLPRSQLNFANRRKAIVSSDAPSLCMPFWSSEFRHFVKMCLKKDLSQRPGAGDLLSHPFIFSARSSACMKPLLVRLKNLPKRPILGSRDIVRFLQPHTPPPLLPSHSRSPPSLTASSFNSSLPLDVNF